MTEFNDRWRRVAVEHPEDVLALTDKINDALGRMNGPSVSIGQTEAFILASDYLETKEALTEARRNMESYADLLGALLHMVEAFNVGVGNYEDEDNAINNGRAAIAKAEGGTAVSEEA